jgi:phosphatidylglycerophosphate synthase
VTAPAPKLPARRWTWSNGLTSLRLLSAPFSYCAIVSGSWGLACSIFWLAVVSDVMDGRLARARGESSAFGGVLDHASDATFVSLGLFALVLTDSVPFVLPFLVLAAFVQYVLDSRILSGRTLRASRLGRWNGILYFAPLGTIVTREALSLSIPPDQIVMATGWALVVSTSISMADRAWAVLSDSGPER